MQIQFFPSRRVGLYMARTFLVRAFAVLGALTIVLQALDLLSESGTILAHPGNGDALIWHYVSLRLPQIISFFLPFSVLLGTLITLATLNQNSEVIAMKAAGISAHQILAPLVLTSLCIAAASFTFNDRIVTRASAQLAAWQAVDYGPVPRAHDGEVNVWVRDKEDIVHAGTARGRGEATVLRDVTVYDRAGNRLRRVISGAEATHTPAGWRIAQARVFDVTQGTVTIAPAITIAPGARPDQFTLADVDADSRSFSSLGDAVHDLSAAGRPTSPLRAELWHKLSWPLSSALMPLLAGIAAFGLARSGQVLLRACMGMALGFLYFVSDNFALAMGNFGAYPPYLAAWAPFLLFLLIGEAVLIRSEE